MSEKLDCLATLALHPTAAEGEWKNAAVKFFQVHRRNGTVSLPGVASTPRVEARHESAGPSSDESVIWFGKHRGRTAAWIAQHDGNYALWLYHVASGVKERFREILLREIQKVH